MNKQPIIDFIKSLNTNAPLIGVSNYKYPYKPILIISIIINIKENDQLFNKDILIDKQSPITKTYYELLTNSETLFNFLNSQNSKESWFLTYNDEVKSSVVRNIFENPAVKLIQNEFWSINKKNKTVRLSIDTTNNEELNQIRELLLNEAIKCLWKCVPDYNGLNINELIDYKEYLQMKLMSGFNPNSEKEKTRRTYQHIFRKLVFERDKKCVICCISLPQILEAAHIKPFEKCENEIEKYDRENGILLCCNHHKLFDRGLFSFDDKWKVIISNELETQDKDLLIKTFESCYLESLRVFSLNEYVKYHQVNIFKRN